VNVGLPPLWRLLRPAAAAVVIPVVEATGLVGDVSGAGMPPHVTLLWPFARRPGHRHRRGLAAIAAEHEQFGFTLARVGSFPGGVTYLAPEPAEPFVGLVRALVSAWPRHQPYGGAFAEVIPHVTVRAGEPLAPDELARLDAALPLPCTAREILLLVPDGEGWREDYRVPLRASTSA